MKLSLCITTFNRSDMVIEVFEKVYDHPLIDQIIIRDDCSSLAHKERLIDLIVEKYGVFSKIKVYVNRENLGMSRNKRQVVEDADNEWVILFDSDNILYPEYLDSINNCFDGIEDPSLEVEKIIFHPSLAEPEHDYSQFNGMVIDKTNAKEYLKEREFRVMMNSCNYIVNRDEYLKVYKYDETIKESDTIYFNTLWLEAGNGFYVVPGMCYHHRKHSGSGWLNGDHRYNMNKAAELQEKIKNL